MESMQCMATLPIEQKIGFLIWSIWCMCSLGLVFGLVIENNKLKTLLKYKDFINKGSDLNE